ncbi:hypothetical protein WR164_07710 [Philodulcilactobacillus myokoensis]|uniref:Uncharacterized protein n=1 Tax=Philodulcilactobacillus myokoensis TaxID=2929573 RepID=A0A9W6EST1_9LACO|nr:hypothetical protein [Philodulcilactobacillus myokoensis]GLB46792.1 hypothetical protein WR164_07710 [Philodulcilactobacillus myokoensis]
MNENDQNKKSNRIQEGLNQRNNQLKDGLNNGLKYTNLIDQLVKTSDDYKLFDAINSLVKFHLNTNQIKFVDQYHSADYCALFMYRFIELHQEENFKLDLENKSQLVVKILGTNTNNEFFYDYDLENDNAYFKDIKYHLSIFSMNLKHKQIRFDGHNLMNLFIIKGYHQMTVSDIKNELDGMIQFSHNLESKLDFSVDLSILNPKNNIFYKFAKNDLPSYIIDKLFIGAAKNDYMLTSYHHTGAELSLGQDLQLKLFNSNDNIPTWGIVVNDKNQQISWFDVILHYDFLRQWYLDNIKVLEVSPDSKTLSSK